MSEMNHDRRAALSLLGSGLLLGAAANSAHAAAAARPKAGQFLWGSAGAAYQIEGGNYASDLWVMENMKPSLFKEPSGDAADGYHRVEEDIAFAAKLGFNTHRLSIEWSRIEPEPGMISRAGLAYYRRVLETVRKHGMVPFVTFNHFTTPRWFAANGGFQTKDGIDPFVRYCKLIASELGDLIGVASTFNEPNLGALVSWTPSIRGIRPYIDAACAATGNAMGAPRWMPPLLGDSRIKTPIMIEAHNRAREAIKQAASNAFDVGITLSLNDDRPGKTPDGVLRKREQVLLPWLAAEGDFVGIQNYTYSIVDADSDQPNPTGVELTQMDYPYAPEALGNVIRTVAQLTKRPIYVTENGVATEDDTRRVAFIDRAVAGVFDCLRDGIDVRGYIHWSLLDNWEWFAGFKPKFGLVEVDRQTFARRPKPSAYHLGRIARNGLPKGTRSR